MDSQVLKTLQWHWQHWGLTRMLLYISTTSYYISSVKVRNYNYVWRLSCLLRRVNPLQNSTDDFFLCCHCAHMVEGFGGGTIMVLASVVFSAALRGVTQLCCPLSQTLCTTGMYYAGALAVGSCVPARADQPDRWLLVHLCLTCWSGREGVIWHFPAVEDCIFCQDFVLTEILLKGIFPTCSPALWPLPVVWFDPHVVLPLHVIRYIKSHMSERINSRSLTSSRGQDGKSLCQRNASGHTKNILEQRKFSSTQPCDPVRQDPIQ